jgi:phage protein D
MGDKLVAARMGEAKAVSGRNLPQIVITPEDCMSWEITPEGRPVYGKVVASYIDQRSGKRVKVESRTGLKGPNNTLKEPYPTKELAEKAAQAEARRLTRNTGEGQFVLAKGRLDTQAEADVLALDFRPGVAGDWRCHAVEREFASDGWGETIEIKGKEDGSSPGAKD